MIRRTQKKQLVSVLNGTRFWQIFACWLAVLLVSICLPGGEVAAQAPPAGETEPGDVLQDTNDSKDEAPASSSPFSEAIEIAQARTVKVYGATVGRVEGYGTGILVSDDGYIITTSGVYLSGRRVRVVLNDGSAHDATLVRTERTLQLALLKIDHKVENYFELSDKPVGEKGDWAVTFSNAFKVADGDEPMSVNLGVISLRTALESMRSENDVAYRGDLVLIDAITSNPGAAGGAVVGLDGQLIGMIGKIIESQDTNTRLNYAVPSDLLNAFLAGKSFESVAESSTTDSGPTKPATLGLRLFGLNGPRSPAYIDRVSRGGPADQASLRPDDLIISVSGQKVSTIRDFQAIEKKLKVGETVIVVVERNDKLIRAELVPVEK